ncbi:MAG: amidase [Actinobacteria bacterium]|nr:amidase [Actinomycetota bacterium]
MHDENGASRATRPPRSVELDADFTGLARQAEQLAAGDVTSAELVEATLARIDQTQGTLNAFRVVRAAAARDEAADADCRLVAGERLPLLGVPVAIKDDTDIAGETTPFGCPGNFPVKTEDAEVVRRLRAAGAIIVGKTNTPEVGQWPVTASDTFGVTRNPWDLERTPGGSSGGTAAAVAAGVLAAAVGSDGAGSVRIPAAWTGLVGIKTQRGRISTWPAAESFNGIAVNGPLARTVEDAALLLDAITGNHPGDLHKPAPPAEPFSESAKRDPGRLRIALSTRIPFSGFPAKLDREIRRKVENLADVLCGLGHDVFEADPNYRLIGIDFMGRSTPGVREWVEHNVPDQTLLDHRTRDNVKMGGLLKSFTKLAKRAEPLLHRQLGSIFKQADVVLAPTTARPPLAADALHGLSSTATDRLIVGACPYSWPWNVLGWPGVNVPAGLTRGGLPVGATLLGPADSEGLLIALAAQLESVERWDLRHPAGLLAGAELAATA